MDSRRMNPLWVVALMDSTILFFFHVGQLDFLSCWRVASERRPTWVFGYLSYLCVICVLVDGSSRGLWLCWFLLRHKSPWKCRPRKMWSDGDQGWSDGDQETVTSMAEVLPILWWLYSDCSTALLVLLLYVIIVSYCMLLYLIVCCCMLLYVVVCYCLLRGRFTPWQQFISILWLIDYFESKWSAERTANSVMCRFDKAQHALNASKICTCPASSYKSLDFRVLRLLKWSELRP